MPLAAADTAATFDDTTGYLDISPVLAAVLLADTATLGLLGLGPPAKAINFFWNEDALNANTVTANESAEYTATDTTLTLTAASVARIRVGALLRDQAVGQTEVLQVTSISGNDCTVTRGFGSTDGQTHAAAAVYAIVGQPVQQGDSTVADLTLARTQVTQRCQNFKRTIDIADERIAEALNGIHPGIGDEFSAQIDRRTKEMMVELNTAVILSIVSGAASDTVYSSMRGLREAITASGGNTAASGVLSEERVNRLNEDAWADGGLPDTLLGHARQMRQFSALHKDRVRIAASDKRIGSYVTKFLTDLGNELDIVVDRWMPTDEVGLLDVKGSAQGGGGGIELCALQNRELLVEPLAKVGSSRRGQIVAAWSNRCKNATLAHGWFTGLVVPA